MLYNLKQIPSPHLHVPGVGTTDSALGEDKVLDIDVSVPLHQVWRDMEGLVESGLVRSIGIRYASTQQRWKDGG